MDTDTCGTTTVAPRPLMAQDETGLRNNNVSVGGVSHSSSSSVNFVLDNIGSPESIDEWSQSAWQGPCVLVVIRKQVASIEQLLVQQMSTWLNTDDVLSTEFVKRVVVVLTRDFQPLDEEPIPSSVRITQNYWFQENGCKSVTLHSSTKELSDLASGPYFRDGGGLHRVSRLYEDFNGAFFSAITQNSVPAFEEQRPTVHIAVPSRTYSAHSSLSLAGLRFGIKDLFAIEGLRTSAGSRSYYDCYPPCPRTAKAIDMLLSSGAILVGKTKNTQFANGEDPQEWIDYSCPWNPRGDGYQNPDTSSSGSASAMSSYQWLDFTVGSDTCGSISCPAAAQGLFSIRSSSGLVPRDDVLMVSEHLDTPGIFARDINILIRAHKAWTPSIPGPLITRPALKPERILFPYKSFPHQSRDVEDIVENFLSILEAYLGVKRDVVDMETEWAASNPVGTTQPLTEYFEKTTAHLHLAGFEAFTRSFIHDHKKKFGKPPYLDRVNSVKLELTKKVTDDDKKIMIHRQCIFASWMSERILQNIGLEAHSSLIIWPFNPQEPQYRDNYPPLTPHVNWRWDIDYIAPLAGLPQVIVTIGQFPYLSRASKDIEYLPVCVSVVAAQGTDHVLLAFLRTFLEESNLPTMVKTGKLAF